MEIPLTDLLYSRFRVIIFFVGIPFAHVIEAHYIPYMGQVFNRKLSLAGVKKTTKKKNRCIAELRNVAVARDWLHLRSSLCFSISRKKKTKKVVLSLGKASLLCAVRENSGRRLISRNYSSQQTMRTPTKIRACVDAPHEFFQIIKSYARHERLNTKGLTASKQM